MLHALDHGFELRRHEAAGLCACDTDRVFKCRCREAHQLAGRYRRCRATEHNTGVPATSEHLCAVQRQPDTSAGLITEDECQQELPARHLRMLLKHGQHGRQQDGIAVQWCSGIIVVQLETLNEAAVEHRGGVGAGLLSAPTHDHRFAASIEISYGVYAKDGPVQV